MAAQADACPTVAASLALQLDTFCGSDSCAMATRANLVAVLINDCLHHRQCSARGFRRGSGFLRWGSGEAEGAAFVFTLRSRFNLKKLQFGKNKKSNLILLFSFRLLWQKNRNLVSVKGRCC